MNAAWSEPEDATGGAPTAAASISRTDPPLKGCADVLDVFGALGKMAWWLFLGWLAITTVTGWFGLIGGAVIVGAVIIAFAVSKDR